MDDISMRIIKAIFDNIAEPIAFIINKCVKLATFMFKMARVSATRRKNYQYQCQCCMQFQKLSIKL